MKTKEKIELELYNMFYDKDISELQTHIGVMNFDEYLILEGDESMSKAKILKEKWDFDPQYDVY